MLARLKKLLRGEEGQGMVEYGLIIALVAIAVIATVTLLGDQLVVIFNRIVATLTSAATK
jgi:pilus assembly protein Flp/PilA